MKLIVLAAGDSFALDGFNKLLIRHPKYDLSILEVYEKVFKVSRIQIVVGYKALDIMNRFPQYDYVYNKNWQTTGNAYSLSLAIEDEPCYIISSDFLLDMGIIDELDSGANYAAIREVENGNLNSLNVVQKEGYLTEVYKGKSKNNDPELIGLFKISDSEMLREWKRRCILNPNAFAGECLPVNMCKIPTHKLSSQFIYEINVPEDYISFIEKIKGE